MSGYRQPTTVEQALTEALYLALIAPDEGKAQAARGARQPDWTRRR